MSATGRQRVQTSLPGLGYARQVDDFYATPQAVTFAILPHLGLTDSSSLLDPCCGTGAILDAAAEWGDDEGADVDFSQWGIEIDAGRAETARESHTVDACDALSPEPWMFGHGVRPTHVVTNPPFRLAMEFVTRALAEVAPGGVVAMLLRLPWLASEGRATFHREHPCDVYVLPRRPSFTGNGKSDSTDYCWMVWSEGRGGRWSILDVEPSK